MIPSTTLAPAMPVPITTMVGREADIVHRPLFVMSLVTVAGRVGGVFGTHRAEGGFRRLHPPYRHLPLANNSLPMTNDQGQMTVNVKHLRRHRPGGEDETKAGRRLELLFFRSAQNVRGGEEQQTCRPVGEGRV